MAHLVLGLVGRMGCGKTTATSYIEQKYGAMTYRFSTPLRDVLARMHVEQSRGNLQALSTFVRQAYGEDLLSKIIAEDAKAATGEIIIVEGIRRPTDVTYLRDVPGFVLVHIITDQKTRFERITARHENVDDQGKTFEQFVAEENQESEQQIDIIGGEATETIDNNGTTDELYTQIDTIISRYGR